jgi:prolyl oligopeptidase
MYNLNGDFLKEIELPTKGSAWSISAKHNREEFFIQFSSYLYPSVIFRFDFSGEEHTVTKGDAEIAATIWYRAEIDFPFDDYETNQVFYTSKDGTKVPMFITHKKGIVKDGNNPVLLYGYGGFEATEMPYFSTQLLTFLEKGSIYAVACIRGGSEYGEVWHRAGMLESKQNTFDDFIAAGEYLIKEKYTSRERLGINGVSNGGLLTAACLTQRPDLFGAVVVGVPVIDMLRYHLFTAGRYWVGEYGCSDDPEQFDFLYKYSPLHNVKMNVVYPPTLIMTADTDDRVVPGQARKFAATLQAADAGENPIVIRIEKSAGHGHGKPINQRIEEYADLYAFLLVNLEG